ncbi:MAG: glycosyl transferase family 2 [Draconibacterium sp.]|nr:MAG: glycosyl transferase family 2 [Draconibacterium sp.]
MVSIDKVRLNFGGFELFRDISFIINPRDRIGLIGKNGAGKTTLLKLINGLETPTTGKISIPKETTLGYLPQQMQITDNQTLKQEAVLAFGELIDLEKRINCLNSEISENTGSHTDASLKKLDTLAELNERYTILGGDNYEAEVEQTLLGLGFERSDFSRHTSEFSGGWRMRIELAKLLLRKPDLLLLDEPTNHLDIESIQWLENFLKTYNGAIVMVSHDKAFLNNVSTRTIEISLGKITDQKLSYSRFIDWKKEQREVQMAAYLNQQKMIDETEKFIERFRYKATKAVQVQSRIKQLEKLVRIEIEPEDNSAFKISFPPPPRSGKVVIEARNVSKKYGNLLVLDDIDLHIEAGEKIAFVGRNGEGKTTLARIIMNELDFKGHVKIGHNVKIGYFAQNQAQLLNGERTVFETIDEIAVGEIRTKIRDILGSFLFSGDDIEKKVKVLSGGEKTRLAMIRLMLEPVNFLVLDEPTNHLDIRSKEILKNALAAFSGTVLVVSHDREFLDGLVNCVYEFRDKKIKQHLGGIYDFLNRKKMDSLHELEIKIPSGVNKSTSATRQNQGLSFKEQKEINRQISRLEKQITIIENEINDIEKRHEEIHQLLSQPDTVDDASVYSQYEKVKNQLEEKMEQWEAENKMLETWKSKKTW